MTEPALVIVGDEAYLPGELCSDCQERPSVVRGFCWRCRQRQPDALAYKTAYRRRSRIRRLEAVLARLKAEDAAIRPPCPHREYGDDASRSDPDNQRCSTPSEYRGLP